MAPKMKIFDDPNEPEESMYNNFRVYGTMLLYCMGTCTFCVLDFIETQQTISFPIRNHFHSFIILCEYKPIFGTSYTHFGGAVKTTPV